MDDWPTNQERAQFLLEQADDIEWNHRDYAYADNLRARATHPPPVRRDGVPERPISLAGPDWAVPKGYVKK